MLAMRSLFVSILFMLLAFDSYAQSYAWNVKYDLPKDRELYLVIKGEYASASQALAFQRVIQTSLKKVAADGVVHKKAFKNLNLQKPWLVGSLFDSKDRAEWWVKYSYRQASQPKPRIKKVLLLKNVDLPYFPSARFHNFLSARAAVQKVKSSPDVKKLSQLYSLRYKITDYPRNGDIRYEIEVLKLTPQNKRGLMYDFFMVDAVSKRISERYSDAFKTKLRSQK